MSVSAVSSAASRVSVDYAFRRAHGAQNQASRGQEAARPEALKKTSAAQEAASPEALKKAAVSVSAQAGSDGAPKLRPAAHESPLTRSAAIDDQPVYTRADVEALLSIWSGERQASQAERDQYDFNSDGRLDSTDLGSLLTRLGQPKPAVPDEPEPVTVEGLLERWNNGADASNPTDARYDLNGDGRIDATDLGALLAHGGRIDSP